MNKASMSNTSNTSSTDQDGTIVNQAKEAVTHVASNVANQAREQVNTQFDTRKDKAVETIGNVASAIRETSEKLKGVGPLGDVAGRAADGIEQVADFFEGKQIGDVVRDVERFARREPAIFVGAAFALGLIGGRFLKSSAHRSTGVGTYARQGGGGERSDSAYGGFDHLSDSELEDALGARRYSAQRAGRSTLPMGSRASATSSSSSSSAPKGTSSQGTSSQGTSSQGSSSFGSSQSSPAVSSFGSSPTAPPTPPVTTPKAPSVAPPPLTSSASSSTTPKNGLGGGNTGSP